jgi:hypothetical protein
VCYNQCCGSALVSTWIRIQHFWSMRIRIQGFHDRKMFIFFSKIVIYSFLSLQKGRPSYRRTSIPQKRTSGTSKLKISSLLCVIFALLDPDSQCGSGSATLVTISLFFDNILSRNMMFHANMIFGQTWISIFFSLLVFKFFRDFGI